MKWRRRTPPEPDPDPVELDVRVDNPTIHVEVSAGGHQVIIESPRDDLDTVTAAVLRVWNATDGPTAKHDAGAGQISVGFHISEPAEMSSMDLQADLPSRLIPEQEDQHDRRDN